APRPGHDRDVDRAAPRRDAELTVAEEGDRAYVALREPVRTDQIPARGLELVDGVGKVHVEELRRVREPLEMLGQAEDGGTPRGLVRPDPFEDARAVVQAVWADVHGRVCPVHELAVHPDLRGLLHRANRTHPDAQASTMS